MFEGEQFAKLQKQMSETQLTSPLSLNVQPVDLYS